MRGGLTPAGHAASSRVRAVVVAVVCMVLVGCGSGTGTSGTVARQPKTCAQLRRQAEAKQGEGGNFECLVKSGKVEGRYSTGELKLPSE